MSLHCVVFEMIQQYAPAIVTNRNILATRREVDARDVSERRARCGPVRERREGWDMDLRGRSGSGDATVLPEAVHTIRIWSFFVLLAIANSWAS